MTIPKPHRKGRFLIVCVVGARPNFMKMAPILRAFSRQSDDVSISLIHTGQHYDEAMSGQLFASLSLPPADINLAVGSASHAIQTAEVMLRFDAVLEGMRPDCLIVVGDVNSTLACALVAAKRNVPVMHVEAGLRSGDRAMPEEINRLLTDQLSSRLYITEQSAAENLRAEGILQEKIRFVGNVMIDSLLVCKSKMVSPYATLENCNNSKFLEDSQPFAVATFHRPSNVDECSSLDRLLKVLTLVSRRLKVVLIMHPRTRERVVHFNLLEQLSVERIAILPPQGYLEMLGFLAGSTVVLTDSGGIQEETTALGIPCLTVRENTERPITVAEGTNTLVPPDPELIVGLIDDILVGRGKQGRMPMLWDGHAAERIVDDVIDFLQHTLDPAKEH